MAEQKWLIQPGETKIIDLDGVRSLKVGLVGGQIDLIGHDEPGARIEVHSVSGRDLKITFDGGALVIDHPQLRWDNFIEVFKSLRINAKADISVLVPRDIALKFGIVSASALVSGLNTNAKLSTVSGDLVVDGLTGNLELNGVSGELSVRNHTGAVAAHTVSGDLTATGAIRKLNADGVTGNVLLDITGTPDAITTNTVSGDLTVRIPEAVGARYSLNTITGRLQVDNMMLKNAGGGKSFTGTAGVLDGSWVDITVNSVSGDVSVLRSSTASDTASSTASDPANDAANDAAPSSSANGGTE